MKKTYENKKSEKDENNIVSRFGKNILTSAVALFLVKFLGFIYRAFLFYVDGYTDEANGYYSSGYEIYALILAVIATGIPNIISRLTAKKIGEKKEEEAYRIFKISFKFFGIISMILSILLFVFADFVATKIYTIPQIALVIRVLAPAIFFVSTSSIIRGHFIGRGDVKPSSSAQVIEQILNCTLTIFFAYLASGKPPHVIAATANVSTTLSVILSFIYIVIFYNIYKKKNLNTDLNKNVDLTKAEKTKINNKEEKAKNKLLLKEILRTAIPITIASFIGVFNIFIDSVTVTRGVQKAFAGTIMGIDALKSKAVESLGIISKVNMIITIPQIVSDAFANILITSTAFYFAKKDYKNLKRNVDTSFKTLFMIIFPAMIGIIVLADPILHLIFPNAPYGAKLLSMYAVSGFLISLNIVMNSVLNGIGKVKLPPLIILFSAVLKTVLNLTLIPIPEINIYGSPIASIISQGVIAIITYILIKKYTKAGFGDFKYILKIILASGIMGVGAYFGYDIIKNILGSRISTILIAIFAAFVYGICLILFKAVDKDMLRKIPFIGKKIK